MLAKQPVTTVATLWLQKSTRFHDKKTLDSQKKLDYKSKLTHSENAQKMRCNAMPTIKTFTLFNSL